MTAPTFSGLLHRVVACNHPPPHGGSARVEMVILIRTLASLLADDYDEIAARRMRAAQAVGGLPGARWIGLVSHCSEEAYL